MMDGGARSSNLFARLFGSEQRRASTLGGMAGETSCVRQSAGSGCFRQQAQSTEWVVDATHVYDPEADRTTYSFTVDSSANSPCGSPDSFSLRVSNADVAEVLPKPVMAADNTFVHTDCHDGLQGTIRWEGLQMQRNSNGHKTATLQVAVNGEVSNLCAAGVRIVDAAGHQVALSGEDKCTFVVSSRGCCRHGFAELMA
jgi:hypothetical protein